MSQSGFSSRFECALDIYDLVKAAVVQEHVRAPQSQRGKYTPLSELCSGGLRGTGQNVNIYGMVVSHTIPKAVRGVNATHKFCMSFSLIDPSHPNPQKTVALNWFTNNFESLPKILAVGDVIRCHAVSYRPHQGSPQLSGNEDRAGLVVFHRKREVVDGTLWEPPATVPVRPPTLPRNLGRRRTSKKKTNIGPGSKKRFENDDGEDTEEEKGAGAAAEDSDGDCDGTKESERDRDSDDSSFDHNTGSKESEWTAGPRWTKGTRKCANLFCKRWSIKHLSKKAQLVILDEWDIHAVNALCIWSSELLGRLSLSMKPDSETPAGTFATGATSGGFGGLDASRGFEVPHTPLHAIQLFLHHPYDDACASDRELQLDATASAGSATLTGGHKDDRINGDKSNDIHSSLVPVPQPNYHRKQPTGVLTKSQESHVLKTMLANSSSSTSSGGGSALWSRRSMDTCGVHGAVGGTGGGAGVLQLQQQRCDVVCFVVSNTAYDDRKRRQRAADSTGFIGGELEYPETNAQTEQPAGGAERASLLVWDGSTSGYMSACASSSLTRLPNAFEGDEVCSGKAGAGAGVGAGAGKRRFKNRKLDLPVVDMRQHSVASVAATIAAANAALALPSHCSSSSSASPSVSSSRAAATPTQAIMGSLVRIMTAPEVMLLAQSPRILCDTLAEIMPGSWVRIRNLHVDPVHTAAVSSQEEGSAYHSRVTRAERDFLLEAMKVDCLVESPPLVATVHLDTHISTLYPFYRDVKSVVSLYNQRLLTHFRRLHPPTVQQQQQRSTAAASTSSALSTVGMAAAATGAGAVAVAVTVTAGQTARTVAEQRGAGGGRGERGEGEAGEGGGDVGNDADGDGNRATDAAEEERRHKPRKLFNDQGVEYSPLGYVLSREAPASFVVLAKIRGFWPADVSRFVTDVDETFLFPALSASSTLSSSGSSASASSQSKKRRAGERRRTRDLDDRSEDVAEANKENPKGREKDREKRREREVISPTEGEVENITSKNMKNSGEFPKVAKTGSKKMFLFTLRLFDDTARSDVIVFTDKITVSGFPRVSGVISAPEITPDTLTIGGGVVVKSVSRSSSGSGSGGSDGISGEGGMNEIGQGFEDESDKSKRSKKSEESESGISKKSLCVEDYMLDLRSVDEAQPAVAAGVATGSAHPAASSANSASSANATTASRRKTITAEEFAADEALQEMLRMEIETAQNSAINCDFVVQLYNSCASGPAPPAVGQNAGRVGGSRGKRKKRANEEEYPVRRLALLKWDIAA